MAPYISERHYAATADETWDALKRVIKAAYSAKGTDDLSRGISFATGATAFTWGQKMSASVMPDGNECRVQITGAANFTLNVGNSAAQSKAANRVFDNLGKLILEARRQTGTV